MQCDRAFKDFFDLVTETYEQHKSKPQDLYWESTRLPIMWMFIVNEWDVSANLIEHQLLRTSKFVVPNEVDLSAQIGWVYHKKSFHCVRAFLSLSSPSFRLNKTNQVLFYVHLE